MDTYFAREVARVESMVQIRERDVEDMCEYVSDVVDRVRRLLRDKRSSFNDLGELQAKGPMLDVAIVKLIETRRQLAMVKRIAEGVKARLPEQEPLGGSK